MIVENWRVGIDIGAYKTRVVVAEPAKEGVKVLGWSEVQTAGLKRFGIISSIPELTETISQAVAIAEDSSGKPIRRVHASISGNYIRCNRRKVETEVRSREAGVTRQDMEVLKRKLSSLDDQDFRVLHLVSEEYVLDQNREIDDPLGMFGNTLGQSVLAVEAYENNVKSISRCLNDAHLEAASVFFGPLTAAHAVLSHEETESGVAYIDLGYSQTTTLIFLSNLRYVDLFPLGGCLVTRYLAQGLKTYTQEGERIKKEYGTCRTGDDQEELIVYDIQGAESGKVSRGEISRIIAAEFKVRFIPHLQKMFEHLRFLPGAGIVLGGGGALLDGLPELLKEKIGVPVRVGSARNIGAWSGPMGSPDFHAALGNIKDIFDGEGKVYGNGFASMPFIGNLMQKPLVKRLARLAERF